MDIKFASRFDASELAALFCANVSTDFISHSELQSYRAEAPDRWAANFREVIQAEIAARLAETPQESSKFVVDGRDRGVLAAIALFSVSLDAVVPFAVLEDLVVERKARGKGHGKEMVAWIAAFVRQRGIDRMFLESGVHNAQAHDFFERVGFRPISTVMMWDMSAK